MRKPIIVITGASRGLGAAIAQHMAGVGAHVVLMARSLEWLERVDDAIQNTGGTATLVPCDLKDGDKIDALGVALMEKYGKVDGIVCNAAILGKLTPLTHLAPKQWQEMMEVNCTAHWRLLRILHPLLACATSPHVLGITCHDAHMPESFWGGYRISKVAFEMLMRSYAHEVAHTAIKVNLLALPPMETALRAQAFPSEDRARICKPHDPRILALVEKMLGATYEAHDERVEFIP